MTSFALRWQRRLLAAELVLVVLIVWVVLISIPLWQGSLSLTSDALNHHIYLGWEAQSSRFELDFLAASYQSYQFPYVYWPAYKLAVSGASGVVAGVTLASLNVLLVPPIWMLARNCMPGRQFFDTVMRIFAVLLAFMTGAILLLVNTTSNDLLASIPMAWAVALALSPLDAQRAAWMAPRVSIFLSGLSGGIAVALKLSNGPIAVLLPVLWLASAREVRPAISRAVLGSATAMAGFLLAYGYWGYLLTRAFGNPIFPFYEGQFAFLREAFGWQ